MSVITQFCQVDDEGVALVYQMINQSTGLPADISAGTELKIRLGYPDGTSADFDAELYTDGTDGKMVYVTGDGDLAQSGINTLQGLITLSSNPIFGEVKSFEVRSNIAEPDVP